MLELLNTMSVRLMSALLVLQRIWKLELKMRGPSLFVLGCCFVVCLSAYDRATFLKRVKGMNPGQFSPSCKKVFMKCFSKLVGLMKMLDFTGDAWRKYTEIECVSKLLSDGFPDYTVECAMNSIMGQFISCYRSPAFAEYAGPEDMAELNPALVISPFLSYV
ncbi:uncharacterized protein LOC135400541 [Ornithodoros turicata]|uniref:uncharacterized protein LOC135400541 n=1 Tax=Ornithodoros turicata TaxID=34597 RepID=UPI00313A1817